MTNPSMNFKKSMKTLTFFALLFLMIQPSFLQAQKSASSASATCTERVVGYANGYVIFDCKPAKKANVCAVTKETCACAAKKYKGAKGCIDGNGNVQAVTIRKPAKLETQKNATKAAADSKKATGERISPVQNGEEMGTPFVVHKPTGETNCRISSAANKSMYISVLKNREIGLVKGGDSGSSRFDFKAIDAEDESKGFYLLTREAEPRALMADGKNLSLRNFKTMDGKMQKIAQWRFFIEKIDKEGNTEYLFMPRNNPTKLVLGVNKNTKKLEMVKRAGGNSNSLVPVKNDKTWNCECIF